MANQKYDRNTEAFFKLLRAGLWEKGSPQLNIEDTDLNEVFRLTKEQAVYGLIVAGMSYLKDNSELKKHIRPFASKVVKMEKRNGDMNHFIEGLYKKLQGEGVVSLLVKGQGIAQCYEKPMWRSCGDVDLFLDEENYKKAVVVLSPFADKIREEESHKLHQAMVIGGWEVELHGTLHCGLWENVDKVIDEAQRDTFARFAVREWKNNDTIIYLPEPNNDVIFVFVHIIQHFFDIGIGLRQFCDWCRLLWTYRNSIDVALLEKRLITMELMTEWKAFAALAVDYLGMPAETMPFYSSSKTWKKKAERIINYVLTTGNLGHNKDFSHKIKYPFVIYKAISFWMRTNDAIKVFRIFPQDSIRAWVKKIGLRGKETLKETRN